MEGSSFVAQKTPRAAREQEQSAGSIRFIRQTGFYPLYDGENDQVDRIGPVSSVRFQRVIPRYRLSASETNDTGLGPAFYETPVFVPAPMRSPSTANPGTDRSSPDGVADKRVAGVADLPPWKGTEIDLYA